MSRLAIYGPLIYTAPYVMLLMRAASITRSSGRGVGPWKLRHFLGGGNGIEPLGECHLGPKRSRFPGPNPLPLAQVMHFLASKALGTGPSQSEVHR
jgi:hypothetical protein